MAVLTLHARPFHHPNVADATGASLEVASSLPTPIMDQTVARKALQELIKNEELDNKKCVDCGNLNPQWASLRSAPI